MKNRLREKHLLLRSRERIWAEIEKHEFLKSTVQSWTEEDQEEFIKICSGVGGLNVMYDFVCKEILNPNTHRERVNEFLSLLLNQKVRILEVLPNDGARIAGGSLLIMDIVVELEDGSIVNLEIQKIGYMFPGQRSACYSADLLLRQYKRVKERYEKQDKKSKNYYKDIKDVYTIVLFERSPKEFKSSDQNYIHRFEQQLDTGVELELLQKYLFVSLDKFWEIKHNKDGKMIHLENKQDAWLAFMCTADPEDIWVIIEQYPEFKEIYKQVYRICQNMEDVMGLFSEELLELDRNTVEFMVDEMQREKDELSKENNTLRQELDQLKEMYEKLLQKVENSRT